MESTTIPTWVNEALDEADRLYKIEADQLRRRLYEESLTEAMREHTPRGLPDLVWAASRWSDGTLNVWAQPKNQYIICLSPAEIRENAAVFAAWLEALEAPAPTEAAPLEGLSNPALVFQSPCQLAGIDFTLTFRPWRSQLDDDEIRRIVAEAVAA